MIFPSSSSSALATDPSDPDLTPGAGGAAPAAPGAPSTGAPSTGAPSTGAPSTGAPSTLPAVLSVGDRPASGSASRGIVGAAAAPHATARPTLTDAQRAAAIERAAEDGLVGDHDVWWGALALGYIAEDAVAVEIAAAERLPLWDPATRPRFDPDAQAYQLAAFEQLELALVLPHAVGTDSKIHVLVCDPTTPQAKRVLRLVGPRQGLALTVATRSYVEDALRTVRARTGGNMLDVDRAVGELSTAGAVRAARTERSVEESEVVRFVEEVLAAGVKDGASDIHFQSLRDGLLVRQRVNGDLHEMTRVDVRHTKDLQKALQLRAGVFGRLYYLAQRSKDRAAHEPVDGSFEWVGPDGRRVDVRMNGVVVAGAGPDAQKVTLRLLGQTTLAASLASRGFEPTMLRIVEEALTSQQGIVLCTGPTGSGKSTTLHAMLASVLTANKSAVTIENPVERTIDGVDQIEVKPDDPNSRMTYSNALRSVLRQDPDVILFGEIRDEESAQGAIQAAQTGHLLLSTTHADTALGAIPRLREFGIRPHALATTIKLLFAQRLVGELCRHCAADHSAVDRVRVQQLLQRYGYGPKFTWADAGLTAQDLAESLAVMRAEVRANGTYAAAPDPTTPIADWQGLRHQRACAKCRNTGYYGRLGVFSIVRLTTQMKHALIDNTIGYGGLQQAAYDNGTRSLFANALQRALRGETSIAAVLEHIGGGVERTTV